MVGIDLVGQSYRVRDMITDGLVRWERPRNEAIENDVTDELNARFGPNR